MDITSFIRILMMDIQADKLQTLIKSAKIVDVEPIWTQLFAKVRRITDYARK